MDSRSRSLIYIVRRLISDRRMIAPMIFLMIGYIIFAITIFTKVSFEQLFREMGPKYIGYGSIIVASVWFYLEFISAYTRNRRDESFSDVDARRREREQTSETKHILDEIRELKNNQQTVDYDKLEALVKESSDINKRERKSQFESFEKYFESLSFFLEEQSQTADEKASILLDKGTMYSRNGIFFFIFTIIAWQITATFFGFKPQHIYGIASCSLLFIFIEFLSAWFLKQYRHYVDTSTYLIKVKSIFDRYMLSYLAIIKIEGVELGKFSNLTSLLAEEIKWPESYLMKNPDISFAKEALETMSHFVKTIKSESNKGKS